METEYSNKAKDLIENGYTIIKNPFTSKVLNSLDSFFDRNLEFFNNNDPYDDFGLPHNVKNGILFDVYQRYPIFRDFAACSEIGEVLKPVLGDHIFLYENSLVYSPAFESTVVPWHQDFQNRNDEPVKYIAFIAIDHLKSNSGALRVLKGSHKRGFLPYRIKKGQGHHTGIPEESYKTLNTSDLDIIEQSPGDILIFNQLIVHSIPSWCSNSLGRGIRFSYQGFDEMYTPRLSPITIFGGSPCNFNQAFKKSIKVKNNSSKLKTFFKNKIKSIFR